MTPRPRNLGRPAASWPLVAVTLLGWWLVAGCSGGGEAGSAASPSVAESTSAAASPTPTPSPAPPAPRPEVGACYRLGYADALAPTAERPPVTCRRTHTATTYRVGTLDLVVDGHLLAVDARRVQRQPAASCPERLGRFLGATEQQLRLSSFRAVWFTPTLEQSDGGQDWYRCDAIALAGPERLAALPARVAGVLRSAEGRARFGICGTAEPGTPRFERVICSRPHGWRAIASYDVRGRRYPGQAAVRDLAQDRCQAAAQAVAEDSLNYRWGYDWPTAAQWRDGQRYGLCWAPD